MKLIYRISVIRQLTWKFSIRASSDTEAKEIADHLSFRQEAHDDVAHATTVMKTSEDQGQEVDNP